MKRAISAAVLVVFLLLAGGRAGAGESMEDVEKDLADILKEMTAVESELDRLEEIAAFPKATGVRIEVHRGGEVAAPVRGRLLMQGHVEEERELPGGDRDAFSGPIALPIVFRLPYLPGEYRARVELYHPSWKTPPSAEFRVRVKTGEIAAVRLRLSPAGGKASPSPSLLVEK